MNKLLAYLYTSVVNLLENHYLAALDLANFVFFYCVSVLIDIVL